jgi:zinc protease
MEPLFPYERHVATLDNGLSVVTVPMQGAPLVAYWSIVRTGSRDEYEPGRTGFAHFFEHMMFRGTEQRPAAEYNRLVTAMGADANAFTSDDLTAYHLVVAPEDLPTVIEIEADRFQHLAYGEPAFRDEAGAVHGEYLKGRTEPGFLLYEAMVGAAFERHTYGHTVIGYREDIERMPGLYDYSWEFFRRYYRPDNVVLLVVGAVDTDETLRHVRRHYGDWEPGYVPPEIPAEPPHEGERRVDVAYPGRTLPWLWLAWKLERFDPGSRSLAAATLLAELAFGETSDLYRRLVLDEQVVETVDAQADLSRDPKLFDLVAIVKDEARVDTVLAAIDAEVARYRDAAPDDARLADVKSHQRYAFLSGLDTPARVARRLARFIALTGGTDAVDRWLATLASVTPDEVRAAAAHVLDPARRTVGVLRAAQE